MISLIRKAIQKDKAAALLQYEIKQRGAVDPQKGSPGFPGPENGCFHQNSFTLRELAG
jgi:hypothetical protein